MFLDFIVCYFIIGMVMAIITASICVCSRSEITVKTALISILIMLFIWPFVIAFAFIDYMHDNYESKSISTDKKLRQLYNDIITAYNLSPVISYDDICNIIPYKFPDIDYMEKSSGIIATWKYCGFNIELIIYDTHVVMNYKKTNKSNDGFFTYSKVVTKPNIIEKIKIEVDNLPI